MKLYKVYRIDNVSWDEYDSFVVRAESEERALELCNEAARPYFGRGLFEKKYVTFVELSEDGPEQVILGSYNAG